MSATATSFRYATSVGSNAAMKDGSDPTPRLQVDNLPMEEIMGVKVARKQSSCWWSPWQHNVQSIALYSVYSSLNFQLYESHSQTSRQLEWQSWWEHSTSENATNSPNHGRVPLRYLYPRHVWNQTLSMSTLKDKINEQKSWKIYLYAIHLVIQAIVILELR